jgi:hypothetical protein
MATQPQAPRGFASVTALGSYLGAAPITATIILDGKILQQGMASLQPICYYTHTPSGHISLLPQVKAIN